MPQPGGLVAPPAPWDHACPPTPPLYLLSPSSRRWRWGTRPPRGRRRRAPRRSCRSGRRRCRCRSPPGRRGARSCPAPSARGSASALRRREGVSAASQAGPGGSLGRGRGVGRGAVPTLQPSLCYCQGHVLSSQANSPIAPLPRAATRSPPARDVSAAQGGLGVPPFAKETPDRPGGPQAVPAHPGAGTASPTHLASALPSASRSRPDRLPSRGRSSRSRPPAAETPGEGETRGVSHGAAPSLHTLSSPPAPHPSPPLPC